MEFFGNLINYIYEFMQQSFEVYGFEISMWQIFLFTTVGTILIEFIGGIISGR